MRSSTCCPARTTKTSIDSRTRRAAPSRAALKAITANRLDLLGLCAALLESSGVEGLQLISAYAIIALAFYFIP